MSNAAQRPVLVVEDEPSMHMLLVDVLHEEGYPVVEAWDGAQAIRAIDEQRQRPEGLGVVLLDMMLPRVPGTEVLAHLAAEGVEVSAIAMSASPSHLRTALAAGARATVCKPFDLGVMVGIVAQYAALARSAEIGPGIVRALVTLGLAEDALAAEVAVLDALWRRQRAEDGS
jgi:CheY-like chemotaxis protein